MVSSLPFDEVNGGELGVLRLGSVVVVVVLECRLMLLGSVYCLFGVCYISCRCCFCFCCCLLFHVFCCYCYFSDLLVYPATVQISVCYV